MTFGDRPTLNRDRELFPWPHDDNDPRYRTDLANVAAFWVRTPGCIMRRATPDGSFNYVEESNREMVALHAQIAAFAPHFPNARIPENAWSHPYLPRVRHHPSQLGGPISEMWQLFDLGVVNPAINSAASYIELGAFLIAIGRWWRARVAASGEYLASQDRPYFSAEAIKWMCAAHAVKTYKIKSGRPPTAFVREGVLGSAQHPTGEEIYTVIVPATKSRSFVYMVGGHGQMFDHYQIEGCAVMGLELPDFFEDAGTESRERTPKALP